MGCSARNNVDEYLRDGCIIPIEKFWYEIDLMSMIEDE